MTPSEGWTLPEGAQVQCPRGVLAIRGKRHSKRDTVGADAGLNHAIGFGFRASVQRRFVGRCPPGPPADRLAADEELEYAAGPGWQAVGKALGPAIQKAWVRQIHERGAWHGGVLAIRGKRHSKRDRL